MHARHPPLRGRRRLDRRAAHAERAFGMSGLAVSCRELLLLPHDGSHLKCTNRFRLAERILDVPSFYNSLCQEANPEATERGTADSEPRSGS